MKFGRLLACSLLLCASCLPKRVSVDGQEMSSSDAAEYLMKEGKDAEGKGERETAKARYKEVVDRFPEESKAPAALLGLARLTAADAGPCAARHHVETLLAEHPDAAEAAEAKAILQGCLGDNAESPAQTPFKKQYSEAGSPAEKRKVAEQAKQAAFEAEDMRATIEWALVLRELAAEGERAAIDKEVLDLIDRRATFQEIRSLFESVPDDAFPKEFLSYKLGRVQVHIRDYENAIGTLEDLLKKWPKSAYADGAKVILKRMADRKNLSPTTIGVLLPLSGPLKAYGEHAFEAVRLAIGELDEKKDVRVNMVVRDSAGDPAKAAKAVEDLVLVDGATVIVGALFRREAEPAAYQAQALGVPLITVSAQEDITNIGPYVFRSGLTNAAQMDALVEYSMDVLGYKTFAVLYPLHPYGEELLRLFWSRVEAKRGAIHGAEPYGARDTTFTGAVRRLVGRQDLELRYDYKKILEECRQTHSNDAYRRERCGRDAAKNLEPIVDFEALFIPDYPSSLALIAPALAVEDVVVERNRRQLEKIEKTLGRKVKPVTLLGASGWNSPDLPTKAGRYVENAIFTDGFFDGAEDDATREFVARFRREFKRAPGLPEAMFYDAMGVAKSVIVAEAPKTREDMRLALRRVNGYPGVTGVLSFGEGGDVKRRVRILTIQEGRIKEAPPPVERAPSVP